MLIHKFKQGNEYYVLDVNTGSLHIIDKLAYDILDENKLENMDDIIKRFNCIYDENELREAYDEISLLILNKELYTEDIYEEIAKRSLEGISYIKALCLNVAHDCNLKCTYCFAEEGEYKGKRSLMTYDVGKRAIDFVIKMSGPRKNIEVDLFGGEPLMAFDAVKKIVEYGKTQGKESNKNIRFTLTTNAMLLNDEIIDFIENNIDNIILSIDGRKEVNDRVRKRADGKGSYDIIMPKIKKMVQKRSDGKQYYARGTFTANNLDFYEDVMHLVGNGFKEISFEPVVLKEGDELSIKQRDVSKILDEYDKLTEEMKTRINTEDKFKFYHFAIDIDGGPCIYKRISGCGAGHEYVSITPEGDIYPCHQFIGNKKFKMGNIMEQTFDKTIGDEFKEAHVYNKPKCKACWAKFYCSGGCQANNYNFNGDMHIPYDIGCQMQKKRIECALALKSAELI